MKAEFKKVNDRFIKTMNDCISRKECKNRVDFAEKLNTTPSTITHINQYKQNIPYPLLFDLRKVFNISINHILFNEGSQRISESKKDTIEDLIQRVSELERKAK